MTLYNMIRFIKTFTYHTELIPIQLQAKFLNCILEKSQQYLDVFSIVFFLTSNSY